MDTLCAHALSDRNVSVPLLCIRYESTTKGWQLVLSSSNISDLLIPTNRISVSYWNAEAGCTCSDPPAHIEPNLRRLLAPDRTGCVSATTVQRLVDKSASMEAVTSVAATDTSVDLTTTKKKRKKQRKKKRNSEPLLVKLQQRAERMGQLVRTHPSVVRLDGLSLHTWQTPFVTMWLSGAVGDGKVKGRMDCVSPKRLSRSSL